MQRKTTAAVLAAALLWLSFSAVAQTATKPEPGATRQVPAQPFVPDSKTLALLDRSSAYLASPGPDGRRRLVTNGGHQHVLMARVGPDGKIETFCAASEHAARSWGAAPAIEERER